MVSTVGCDLSLLQAIAAILDLPVVNILKNGSEREFSRQGLIRDWLAAFGTQDVAGLLSQYRDDAALHIVTSGLSSHIVVLRGHRALKRYCQKLFASCQIRPMNPDDCKLYMSQDSVLVRLTHRVSERQTQRTLSAEGLHEFELLGNRIKKHFALFVTTA